MYVDTIVLCFFLRLLICISLLRTPGITSDLRTALSQHFSEDTCWKVTKKALTVGRRTIGINSMIYQNISSMGLLRSSLLLTFKYTMQYC